MDPSSTLQLSRQAPKLLSSSLPRARKFPFTLLDRAEGPATWIEYEALFQACLRAGDDESAHHCLELLSNRFGSSDKRVIGLRGMYEEAIATNTAGLEKVLQSYEKVLAADPMNVPVLKRRVAIQKSLSRPKEAITALVEFLEVNVTDAEAWCELADLYCSQSMMVQAGFCLEEALLITPNAWNLHAWLGEIELEAALGNAETSGDNSQLLADAVRRFGRSIELCDNYLRAYYGMRKASRLLLDVYKASRASSSPELPSQNVLEGLHDLAGQKLQEIVDVRKGMTSLPDVAKAELLATQDLLNQSP